MSPQSTVARFSIALFAALGAFLAIAAPSAIATETHPFISSFGPDGTSATSFSHPASIAVDQQTHDVYVADLGVGAIYRFAEDGSPLNFTGTAPDISANAITGVSFRGGSDESQIAVDSQTGTIYATATSALLAFQESGEPAKFTAHEPYIPTNGLGEDENKVTGFGALLGVAVDENGDIYTGDYSAGGHVDVYAPSGERLTSFESDSAANLAVDSHGAVYVDNDQNQGGPVKKYFPSVFPVTTATKYTSAAVVDQHVAFALAVEPGSDHLYVDQGSELVEYSEGGAVISEFADSAPGAISGSTGVGVDGATGTVYAANPATGKVIVFGPAIILPTVTTGPPTSPGQTSATLTGTVDPAGGPAVTGCQFEYGPQSGQI